jgi:hypothetical protein
MGALNWKSGIQKTLQTRTCTISHQAGYTLACFDGAARLMENNVVQGVS